MRPVLTSADFFLGLWALTATALAFIFYRLLMSSAGRVDRLRARFRCSEECGWIVQNKGEFLCAYHRLLQEMGEDGEGT